MPNVFPIKAGRYRLTTDGDLYIDEFDVIRQNVSEFWDPIIWNEGDSQIFKTIIPAVEVSDILVNGQRLIREQYKVLPDLRVEITELLEGTEYIIIMYKHFVIDPLTGEQPVYPPII